MVAKSTSATSRASTARPIWPAASRTPGMARSCFMSAAVAFSIAGRDVPACACTSTNRSVSLKEGISDRSGWAQNSTPTSSPPPISRQAGHHDFVARSVRRA